MKRVASAAGFITELQDSLSDEAYEDFKKALGTYRKVGNCRPDFVVNSNFRPGNIKPTQD